MSRFIRQAGQDPNYIDFTKCSFNTTCNISASNFCGSGQYLTDTFMEEISRCCYFGSIGSTLTFVLPCLCCYRELFLEIRNLASACTSVINSCISTNFCAQPGTCWICYFNSCTNCAVTTCYNSIECRFYPSGCILCLYGNSVGCLNVRANIDVRLKPYKHLGNELIEIQYCANVNCCGDLNAIGATIICCAGAGGSYTIPCTRTSRIDFSVINLLTGTGPCLYWNSSNSCQIPSCLTFCSTCSGFCAANDFYWVLYGKKALLKTRC